MNLLAMRTCLICVLVAQPGVHNQRNRSVFGKGGPAHGLKAGSRVRRMTVFVGAGGSSAATSGRRRADFAEAQAEVTVSYRQTDRQRNADPS